MYIIREEKKKENEVYAFSGG